MQLSFGCFCCKREMVKMKTFTDQWLPFSREKSESFVNYNITAKTWCPLTLLHSLILELSVSAFVGYCNFLDPSAVSMVHEASFSMKYGVRLGDVTNVLSIVLLAGGYSCSWGPAVQESLCFFLSYSALSEPTSLSPPTVIRAPIIRGLPRSLQSHRNTGKK